MVAKEMTMSDEHKEAISKLAYAVSEKFGVGMYDSCRDVQNPSSGKHALDMPVSYTHLTLPTILRV